MFIWEILKDAIFIKAKLEDQQNNEENNNRKAFKELDKSELKDGVDDSKSRLIIWAKEQ